MKLWQDLRKSLKKAGEKTSGFTRMGRIKIDILGLKREIEEKFIELGGRVYQLGGENKQIDLNKDKEIAHLIEQIRELEQELESYEQALQK